MKFIFKHLGKIVATIFVLGVVYAIALVAGAGWLVRVITAN